MRRVAKSGVTCWLAVVLTTNNGFIYTRLMVVYTVVTGRLPSATRSTLCPINFLEIARANTEDIYGFNVKSGRVN
jgi:hypothetical protein